VGRLVRIGVAVALVAAFAFFVLPYLDALGFIVRASGMDGAGATAAAWRTHAFTRSDVFEIPTRRAGVPNARVPARWDGSSVPARFYRPATHVRRTVLLIPGVHRDGIEESRLVGLARDLAATGYGVLTVAAPDLQQFRITPEVTDAIEDTASWAAAQKEYAPDGRVGILGISFSGGLSIVAAGRPSIRDKVAFVLSFGGHGDLARVLHYLCSGEVVAKLDEARTSSAVLGASHVSVHPPHDYGVAVVLLSMADRVVPAAQVTPLVTGINRFLLASSLALTDTAAATREFAAAREYAEALPEPARTLMRYVNDRAVDKLGPILLPLVDALKSHPAMPALSPERAAPPSAPVFLLHGVDDNVIPSVETVLLGEYLEGKSPVMGLLSGLITHAEVDRTASMTEVWRLASFWREVMRY
jgi:hypothetical protein